MLNKKVKANQANQYGMTPLHFAVANQDIPMVEFLVRECTQRERGHYLQMHGLHLTHARGAMGTGEERS